MAKKLKVGDVIRGYRIVKVFGPGMMAISYAAVAPSGRKVFLKQYKSPAPTVVWYPDFVAYQKEVAARVVRGKADNFAVGHVDSFEEMWGGRCYFQAFEFVENGADLQQVLDKERESHRATKRAPTSDPAIWQRHATWAKVLVAGVGALHDVKIVHADLKPANAYLIEDPTIASEFQLKLIDMDFSLLADRRPPWHGHQGYVGTDNYRSPEHLTRGAVPGLASDMFTCGVILYELLAGHHPYWSEDQADYARKVQGYAARPPALLGQMPWPASNADVSAALHRCLDPNPAGRPTATELRAILSGRNRKAATAAPAAPVPAALRPASPPAPAAAPGPALVSDAVELIAPGGRTLRLRIRTELGKRLMRQFGDEAEFWDERQCVLERGAGGQWSVKPAGPTTNQTLVNGRALTGPQLLQGGDQIAVGNEAKKVAKLPLIVRAA
ncbi:protein kinase [Sphingomonas sp. LY29]|uniref:protein kinase domain-containing protein n=1 Tax=Sphingomonas sp. LY29 TaxID=3095341 RepID=UPI002D79CC24|nr:protein kinase [Sphingomonas sp. LY29]WRP26404.1 protein kinase [Sphingomonas sp. LY29]